MAIHGIPATSAIHTVAKAAETSAASSTAAAGNTNSEVSGFSDLLAGMVGEANNQQLTADVAMQKLVTGEESNVQDVALAMAKADISFQFVMEIRNRLIDSYQEIMRMQV